MAKNQVFREGSSLSLPVPTGTAAGSSVRVGAINAVTVTDEGSMTATIALGLNASLTYPSGGVGNQPGYASCTLEGAYSLPVAAGAAVSVGQAIYIKANNNTLTDAASRSVTDGATTSGSTTVTSATANFTAADAGSIITGAGIPAGTTIASVTNATTVVLSAAATATATGVSLTIGGDHKVFGTALFPIAAAGTVSIPVLLVQNGE